MSINQIKCSDDIDDDEIDLRKVESGKVDMSLFDPIRFCDDCEKIEQSDVLCDSYPCYRVWQLSDDRFMVRYDIGVLEIYDDEAVMKEEVYRYENIVRSLQGVDITVP